MASTYTAPASDSAEIQALYIADMLQRQAMINGWFSNLAKKVADGVKKALPYVKKNMELYDKACVEVNVDDDVDDNTAEI